MPAPVSAPLLSATEKTKSGIGNVAGDGFGEKSIGLLGGLSLLAYGLGIELAQANMGQGRHASMADLVADGLGILLALALISLGKRLFHAQQS